jgi:uridylate kinase
MTPSRNGSRYERLLIKLSGEALSLNGQSGIDMETASLVAKQIKGALKTGAQIAIVVGGGNI